MKRLALLVLALACLTGNAPTPQDDGIPQAFQGAWAREGGHCTDGNVQMEGMLTIQHYYMNHGDTGKHVMAVRRVSDVRIGVDSKDSFDEDDAWTATTLLTFEPTRKNGRRLRTAVSEMYQRCP